LIDAIWSAITVRIDLCVIASTSPSNSLVFITRTRIKEILDSILIGIKLCSSASRKLHIIQAKNHVTDTWAYIIAVRRAIRIGIDI
jgi:hypothetical protein